MKSAPQRLSHRMGQVLELLLLADSEKLIARRLRISINTVHTYVKTIYRHFEVGSRAELFVVMRDQPPAHLPRSRSHLKIEVMLPRVLAHRIASRGDDVREFVEHHAAAAARKIIEPYALSNDGDENQFA